MDPNAYIPEVGFVLTIDFASKLPREVKTMKAVFVGFDDKMQD